MYFELSVTILALLLLLEVWRVHAHLMRAVRTPLSGRSLARYPSVSVIRPIKGLDAGAAENLAAAFDHGYPGEVETLFVLDDEHEPAVPLVEAAIVEHRRSGRPGTAELLFCGQPPAGRTGKLNAMVVGLRRARGELIAFADSDIRPAPGALSAVVERLESAVGAGAAFAPVVVVSAAKTFGDAGYALMLNGMYGPTAAMMVLKNGGELPFIMGQLMVLKREAIAAIGGLETAHGQLVDDMYLGLRLNKVGLRNVSAPVTVPIIQEGLSLASFASIYRRWIIFSRTGLPSWEFKLDAWLRGVGFWVGIGMAAVALAVGHWVAAGLALLVPLATVASINALHRALGGAPLSFRHRFAALGLLLTAPFVLLSIYFKHTVTWRGRSYDLDASSRLSTAAVVPKPPSFMPAHSETHGK